MIEQLFDDTNKVGFNINLDIYVKMSHDGFVHMQNEHNKYVNKKLPLQHFLDKADESGYVKMQMWKLMQNFGETMCMSVKPLFETDIYFQKRDLKFL